jgi:hypothetical protein
LDCHPSARKSIRQQCSSASSRLLGLVWWSDVRYLLPSKGVRAVLGVYEEAEVSTDLLGFSFKSEPGFPTPHTQIVLLRVGNLI